MSYSISLKLQPETHQRFKDLHSRLNAGERDSLARPLGENLADMACEIIDQIFGQVVQLANSPDSDSEKVIQQIMHNTRKYMPWSVSLFGNLVTIILSFLSVPVSITFLSKNLKYSEAYFFKSFLRSNNF